MLRKFVFLSALSAMLAMAAGAGAQELGKGKVLWEYWFGGGINNSLPTLKANADFPDDPAISEWRTEFSADRPNDDYYGGRGRAFLTAPETGEYTFWVYSDDDSELYISTDEDPANAELIASVTGWTGTNEWGKYPTQKSAPRTLEAGKRYYIEALYSDGTGGGNVGVGWGGPGIGAGPIVISGAYLTALIRDPEPLFGAQNPNPANGAVDVVTQVFEWTPGLTAVAHDVYFGTDPNFNTDPNAGPVTFMGRQSYAMYFAQDTLIPGAKYYWRVDEIEADGTTVRTGKVWTFTVKPIKAYHLSPYNGALNRYPDTKLSWTAGNLAESHDVYFDVNEANVTLGAESAFMGNQTDTVFDPNGLALATTYYWRVDEVQADGTKIPGDVLSFTTIGEGVFGATGERWLDIAGTAVSDLTSSPRFLGEPNVTEIVPDFEAPTDVNDNYGYRLRAWLNVPAAGEYTFWVASDDASELWLGADEFTDVKICQVDGWAPSRGWDQEPGAKSAPIQLEAGKYFLMALMKEGGGGDNLSAAWQGGPILERELILGGFLEPYEALWANSPSPADDDVNVPYCVTLSWKAGTRAAAHNVYLGTNEAAVAAGDASTFQGQFTDTSYTPAPLRWNTTYYWRVDEVNDAEADSPWVGHVFKFNVPDYIALISAPEGLDYDNTADPFVSEAVFDVGALSNFKARGVSKMQLEVKGNAPKFSVADGTYTLQGAGEDIWAASDQFRYAYKSLTGDGSIVAHVVSIGEGSNTWAKGGVMVRATLDANSPHMIMALTGGDGGGIAFQGRQTAGGNSSGLHGSVIAAAPYWVKLVREGNSLAGYCAADPNDGQPVDANDWVLMWSATPDNSGFTITNPQEIELPDTVNIGLFVTSHAAGELRTFVFDNVTVDGNVAGDWQVADIGVAQGGNDPAPLFVALVDKAGAVKAVAHPGNPTIVTDPNWSTWNIPMSSFSGVNLEDVNQLVVGVGDGTAGGVGSIQFRNVRLMNPTSFSIPVVNSSFEQPGKIDEYWYRDPPLARSLGNLPGWSTDAVTTKAGFVKGAGNTKGSWAAYVTGGGPALWQLTNHVALEGEVFQLDVDASVILGMVRDKVKNLKMSLYYVDDAGKRVSIGSSSTTLPYDPQPRSLTVTASNVRKCIGRKVGIEFSNLSDNVIAVDNVRLKVK